MAPSQILSLGLSLGQRTGAAVLLQNQKMVAAAVEQRRGGRSATLPLQAVEFCLHQAGLSSLNDVHVLGIQSRSATDWTDFLATQFAADKGWIESILTFPTNLREELRFRSEIREELEQLVKPTEELPELALVADELALAQGMYATAPLAGSAYLVLDVPFARMASGLWIAKADGSLEQIWLREFPQSLELLVHNLAAFCGFRGRMGQRQFLQLAEYGENRFTDLMTQELLTVDEQGGFKINLDFLETDPHDESDWKELRRLFQSEPRRSTQPISSREIDMAYALLHAVLAWTVKLDHFVLKELNCSRLTVRASGPLTEKIRTPWRKQTADLDVKFSAVADESLLMAAGAAIEALATKSIFPNSAEPMELRPASAFRQYARPVPGPLTTAP